MLDFVSIIGPFFLGLAVSWVWWMYQRWLWQKLWGFSKRDRIRLVVAAWGDESSNRIIGLGETYGVVRAVESLAFSYHMVRDRPFWQLWQQGFRHRCYLTFHSEIDDDRWEDFLIVLGGPKYNDVTREYFDRYKDLPLRFREETNGAWVIENEELVYRRTDDVDYALITRVPNISVPAEKDSFVLAALGTWGIKAAAEYIQPRNGGRLAGKSQWRWTWCSWTKRRHYQVLLEVPLRDGLKPQLIQRHDLTFSFGEFDASRPGATRRAREDIDGGS